MRILSYKMSIQKLHINLLNKILGYLSFAEVSRLRGTSKILHLAAKKCLNSAFLELGPRLVAQYTSHLISLKNNRGRTRRFLLFTAYSPVTQYSEEMPCDYSAVNIRYYWAFAGTTSQIAKVVLLLDKFSENLQSAKEETVDSLKSIAAGEILDLFYELQRSVFPSDMQDEENRKLARLILLIDQYLDWFEKFRMTSEEVSSWYGTCIVDLLDSHLSSTYHLVASHHGSLIKLSGRYVIKGQSEAPPKISEPLGRQISQKELLQVLKYIRKHVRWSNFVTAVQGEVEYPPGYEEAEANVSTKRTQEGYQRTYKGEQFLVGDINESVESFSAVVSLHCNRRHGPARLRRGFEDLHEWKKKMDAINLNISHPKPISIESSVIEPLKELNKSFEEERIRLKMINQKPDVVSEESRLRDDDYTFNLEVRAVYPKLGTGEKFGEAILNIILTPSTMFAAYTECSLY